MKGKLFNKVIKKFLNSVIFKVYKYYLNVIFSITTSFNLNDN